MEEGKKPTVRAQRRFEALPGMHPTTVSLGGSGGYQVKGTVVDISPGTMCVRLSLTQADAEALGKVEEGDPIEAEVSQSPTRRWIVLGRLAWVWVPSMEPKDTIGSVGIDVAGVIEEDHSWLGKIRGALVRDAPVEVDLKKKKIVPPAARRRMREQAQSSSPESPNSSSPKPAADSDEER